jgi:hypothetical protein
LGTGQQRQTVINPVAVRILARGRHIPVANGPKCRNEVGQIAAGQSGRHLRAVSQGLAMGPEYQRVFRQSPAEGFSAGEIIWQESPRYLAIEITEIEEIRR